MLLAFERFEVLMKITVKIIISRDKMMCDLIDF
jgi:hypothetical protein